MRNLLLPTFLCVILAQVMALASSSVVATVNAEKNPMKNLVHEAMFSDNHYVVDLLSAATAAPSIMPTASPSAVPTYSPSAAPTYAPSVAPTAAPSTAPTFSPSAVPSRAPTFVPTTVPSRAPTATPSRVPTLTPSFKPTAVPSTTAPSPTPTRFPTRAPIFVPGATSPPTIAPTQAVSPVVSMNSSFVIKQVTEPVLSQNAIDTYLTTVATIAKVARSNVKFLGYRILSQQGQARRLRMLLVSQKIVSQAITYTMEVNSTIVIPLVDYPQYQNNVTQAASNVVSNIATAIATQDFTTTLQTTAQTNTASEFLLANVTSASVAPVVVDTPVTSPDTVTSSSSSQSSSLTDGQIAGVVIGVFFGALLLVGGVYLFNAYMVHKHEDHTRVKSLANRYAAEPTTVVGPYSDDILVISIEENNVQDQPEASASSLVTTGGVGRTAQI